ncbi:MAG: aminomethyl-transferring glycine dehydrogenase [Mariniblastus sp.]|nr:aminomethyl-transferring glycine dehydrogenase [Mariniblastus sp.]
MTTKAIEHETLEQLMQHDDFIHRHIGPSDADIAEMLKSVGATSLDDLIKTTVPASIELEGQLDLPSPSSEPETLQQLAEFADRNQVFRSFIGMGYYGTHVPSVILRNVLENPGWYTAYTPYQAEISQGRLESLLNFQQMIMDLTAMEMANASLLDEATAAAEAMTLCKRAGKQPSNLFFIANDVHPQTIDVLRTRAEYFGFEIVTGAPDEIASHDLFGALLQYPGTYGQVNDLTDVIEMAHEQKALVAVSTDLLSLALLKPPGEMGADIVVGSAQRFGVPMGYGGPHAAFFATRDAYKRSAPGRIIGVSRDARGKTALRMAMQTREQHIRRDKATSNICTAQALLANMAGLFAVYHGPQGILNIAKRVHRITTLLAAGLDKLGFPVNQTVFFDTVSVTADNAEAIVERARQHRCNLRYSDTGTLGISLDETTTEQDVELLWEVFSGEGAPFTVDQLDTDPDMSASRIPPALQRTSAYLQHEVFNKFHSETEMLRYLKRLENRDFSLTHGMIPLGSCTMKLNATTEMVPVTWPAFAEIHPFAPPEQTLGYDEMIAQLEKWLVEITGYDGISMQPNSGAQGEYAGLLAIRRYHQSRGESHRDICLIPSSAHGTNPATASMMGLNVVVIKTDENGNIDMEDLVARADEHADNLSSLMITYPSTHGVFEETVQQACQIIHERGGQVYLDGANMNALVGLTTPGLIGSDVSHLNLHKTFCIPHGGGGPGMGPIGVKKHLVPFLPNHVVRHDDQLPPGGAVSAAPYGSAAILPISWAYIHMMGGAGLKKATQVAILNANYIAARLKGNFEVLYKGRNGRVAHECIVDIRPIREACGIDEKDIAKRLMDYGFHAPTMSWPVPGTIMIEPTESESKYELDRFCDALLEIREEIRQVENGELSADESLPRNAPHTMYEIADKNWSYPEVNSQGDEETQGSETRKYSRNAAVFPSHSTRQSKFWPAVNRIDDVYGDRNFVCNCPPLSAYEDDLDE